MTPRFLVLPICVLVAACGGGGDSGGPGAPANPGLDLPLNASPVEFGTIGVGEIRTRVVQLSNPPNGTAAPVTAIRLPSPGFVFGSDRPSLPLTLPAGRTLAFEVVWQPSREGSVDVDLEVDSSARPMLKVALRGTAFAEETTVDLGSIPFDAFTRETADITVDIPEDAISFSIEAAGGSRFAPSGGALFLTFFSGPGNKLYVDPSSPHAGPYKFERNFPGVALNGDNRLPFAPRDLAYFHLPNTDNPNAQLVSGGGFYRFRLSNQGGNLPSVNVRVLIERRPGAQVVQGSVPLNIFLSNGLGVGTTAAPGDAHIQAILERADDLLGLAGLGFGDISYFRIADGRFDVADPFNPGPLVQQSSIAPEARVNVFMVSSVLLGAAGISAGIPGPRVNGTSHSGLFVLANAQFNPEDLGTILAHEICHYLGLGHSREQPGAVPWTHDLIVDTCPGFGCVDNPALNLMIPESLPPGPPELTPGQVYVLRRSGHVRAAAPTFLAGGSPRLASARNYRSLDGFQCANCGAGLVR